MMKIKLTKLEHPVNALCFLLLEEVEWAFGSTFQDVASFSVWQRWTGGGGRLGEPMLSALSNRASRQQMKMTMEGDQCKEIQLNNKGSAEALLNLASMGALEKGFDIMFISAPIEAAGWSALASAVTLVRVRGITVDSAMEMADSRIEDIRQIWDHLAGPRKYVMVNKPFMQIFGPDKKEAGLEDLEKLLEETVSSHSRKFSGIN